MPLSHSLEQQMGQMQEDMREMRGSMKLIAEAITRLAVLEERHQNTATTVRNYGERVDRLEERERAQNVSGESIAHLQGRVDLIDTKLRTTELKQAASNGKEVGAQKTMKIVWTVVGGVLTYVASVVVPPVVRLLH